ncbi:MAG: hypothetical protein IJE84_00890 [Clostridia bacterium]|nr:hypothetical protein [Clostridia bacterium]
MKIIGKIFNALGAIIAALLVPVLIALLIATPVVCGVCSLANPDKLSGLIKSIDFGEIVLSSPDLSQALEDAGVSPDAVGEILGMDIVEEFTDMYLEDVTSILSGEQTQAKLNRDSILALYDKYSDDVLELIKTYSPEPIELSDKELSEEVRTLVEEQAEEILTSLPTAEDIRISLSSSGIDTSVVADAFNFARTSLTPILIGVLVIFSLIIFALRAYHLEGTIWLGIVYTLVAVLMFSMLGSIPTLSAELENALDGTQGLSSVSGIIGDALSYAFMPFAVGYAIVGVLLIASFVLVRIYYHKKKKSECEAQPLYDAQNPIPLYVPSEREGSHFTEENAAPVSETQEQTQDGE